jgi:hypothetical protein
MSVTTTTAPTREVLVEAVAAVDAAASVLRELVGDEDEHAEFFDELARRLKVEVLAGPPNDEWTPDHPVVVEVEARSNELEADALERGRGALDRVPVLRARAADYREQGTTDIMFWTGERGTWS